MAEMYYWPGGTWVKVEGGKAKVGVTEALLKKIPGGKISSIRFTPPGTRVKQGEKLAVIMAGKTSIVVESPITGVIEEVNQNLRGPNVTLILKDPYGEGSIAIIKPEKLEEDLKNLEKKE
ncbi:hypothetical protein DRN41_00290 [Thermococci archaeon]|nr:MAG: hypothetical protein DRN41_00290 [Thermococci archaeon]